MAGAVACDRTPASQTTPTPAPTATATAHVPGQSQIPVPLGAQLTGADLAKFNALPQEYRDALSAEGVAVGFDFTLGYLRRLPDQVQPPEALLSPEALATLRSFTREEQYVTLLGGYLYARDYSEYVYPDSEFDPVGSMGVFVTAIQRERGDKGGHLPPMGQALSSRAMAKFDSQAPELQRAFTLQWEDQLARDL
ncbi:MAG: hypothetical protein FJ319_01540 [SAR202 cluster bacterium]|nr:hypothetical protein [SAR202 cluster bacterium]